MDNVEVIKGLTKYPSHYGINPDIRAYGLANSLIWFNLTQKYNFYQDTEIEDIKYYFYGGGGNWYVALYKYDLPNNKFLKQCQWDCAVPTSGDYTFSLSGGPVTIGTGTYFIAVKSDTTAVLSHASYYSSNDRVMSDEWNGEGLPNDRTQQLNIVFYSVDPAVTVLPDEIDFTSYVNTTFKNYAPYLPYLIY